MHIIIRQGRVITNDSNIYDKKSFKNVEVFKLFLCIKYVVYPLKTTNKVDIHKEKINCNIEQKSLKVLSGIIPKGSATSIPIRQSSRGFIRVSIYSWKSEIWDLPLIYPPSADGYSSSHLSLLFYTYI